MKQINKETTGARRMPWFNKSWAMAGLLLLVGACGNNAKVNELDSRSVSGGDGSCDSSGCCGFDCVSPFIGVTDEKCIGGDDYVNLSWTNPIIFPGPDKILVLRKSNSIVAPNGGMGVNPGHPLDPFSEVVYFGAPTNFLQDLDVESNTWYHYGIWTAKQVGTNANGEPEYEYTAQGSFCQAYTCNATNVGNPDPIDDPVVVNPGDGAICLDWTLPADSTIVGVRIYRSLMPFVGEPKDDPNATVIFEGPGEELIDTDVVNNSPYYYAIYTINEQGILSDTAVSVSDTPVSILPTPQEVKRLSASDPQSGARYGHSVDIRGDIMLVGAYAQTVGTSVNAGKVYVYERIVNNPLTPDDDEWNEIQTITAPVTQRDEIFGEEVFIRPDNELIVIGAPKTRNDAGDRVGAVYLYERNANGQWIFAEKIVAPSGTDVAAGFGAEFYYGQNDSGEELLTVGASGHSSSVGRVYFYEKVAGAWTLQQTLESPVDSSDFRFGREVSGDLAGQFAINGGNQIFIYEKVAGSWTAVQTITGSDTVSGDGFGHEVGIDNNIMVISAPRKNNPDLIHSNSGAVYVFAKDANGVWVEQQQLLPSASQTNERFGEDLDISGNLLAVGADQFGATADNIGGRIYIYRFDGTSWGELGAFGTSVSQSGAKGGEEVRIDGNTLILGASRENDDSRDNSGAAYVFDITAILNLCVAPPAPQPQPIVGTYNSVPAANSNIASQSRSDIVSQGDLGNADRHH